MHLPKRATALLAVAVAIIAGGAGFASAGATTSSNYTPLVSTRVLDTRTGNGAPKAPVASGATLVLDLTKAAPGATAVTLNLTETNATGGGYVLAYTDGVKRPNPASTLNFGKGQTIANNVTVAVTDGKVDIYNGSNGSADLVADLEGYYTASAAAYVPPATLTANAAKTLPETIATGGHAYETATDVVELTFPTAGTYQVSVNAKATPIVQLSAGQPTGVQIFPEFYVYNQVISSTWAGNEFNVGSGALESGQNNQIDSYYSGSGLVTVTAGEELHFYAGGYDSDRGAGTYTLDALNVVAVPVTPAS